MKIIVDYRTEGSRVDIVKLQSRRVTLCSSHCEAHALKYLLHSISVNCRVFPSGSRNTKMRPPHGVSLGPSMTSTLFSFRISYASPISSTMKFIRGSPLRGFSISPHVLSPIPHLRSQILHNLGIRTSSVTQELSHKSLRLS